MRSKVRDTSLQPGTGRDLTGRLSKSGSVALMVLGAILLLSAGVHATTAEAISGYAMRGCGGDPDDPPGKVQPCIARYLSGVWVGLVVGRHTVASTVTNSEGRFQIGGSGEVLGGGSCGEQPRGELRFPGSEVALFYPNDGDDSPYGRCPATMNGAQPVTRHCRMHRRRHHRRCRGHRHSVVQIVTSPLRQAREDCRRADRP
jgi:hypothetical protein